MVRGQPQDRVVRALRRLRFRNGQVSATVDLDFHASNVAPVIALAVLSSSKDTQSGRRSMVIGMGASLFLATSQERQPSSQLSEAAGIVFRAGPVVRRELQDQYPAVLATSLLAPAAANAILDAVSGSGNIFWRLRLPSFPRLRRHCLGARSWLRSATGRSTNSPSAILMAFRPDFSNTSRTITAQVTSMFRR